MSDESSSSKHSSPESSDSSDTGEGNFGSLFALPDDYYAKPEPPHIEVIPRVVEGVEPAELHVRLPGEHSLWAHKLWNAAKVLSKKIDRKEIDVEGKTTLELGAGGGLPSMTAALCGAKLVVATDYPDKDIIRNLEINFKKNIPAAIKEHTMVAGYLWGNPMPEIEARLSAVGSSKFDFIFLSDLIFNHTEHRSLARVVKQHLAPGGECHVLWSHHIPPRRLRDLQFFRVCLSEELVQTKMESIHTGVMFIADDDEFGTEGREYREHVYHRVITHPPSE